jgi:hypothetical protein
MIPSGCIGLRSRTGKTGSHSQVVVRYEIGMVGAIGFEPMTSTV